MKHAQATGTTRSTTMAARLRSRAARLLGTALTAATLLVLPGCSQMDEPGSNQATVSELKELAKSVHRTDDGRYQSALGPVEQVDAKRAATLMQQSASVDDPQEMRSRCWAEGDIITCCSGYTCCVIVDAWPYCG